MTVPIWVCVVFIASLVIMFIIIMGALVDSDRRDKLFDTLNKEKFELSQENEDITERYREEKSRHQDAIERRNKIQDDYNNLLQKNREVVQDNEETKEMIVDLDSVVRGCIVTLAKHFDIDLEELKQDKEELEENRKKDPLAFN